MPTSPSLDETMQFVPPSLDADATKQSPKKWHTSENLPNCPCRRRCCRRRRRLQLPWPMIDFGSALVPGPGPPATGYTREDPDEFDATTDTTRE